MNIYSKQIATFLNGAINKTKLILLHGPEDAIVYANLHMVLEKLQQIYPEAEITKLSYSEIKEHPVHLIDEMRTNSLFASQKILIVEDCSSSCNKELQKVLQGKISVEMLIMVAGDLAKSSTLRQTVEKLETGMSIACYKPDVAQLQQHIRSTLNKLGVKTETGVVEVLANIMPPNPMLIDNELEKVCLYKNNEPITIADLAVVYENASELSLDDLCLAIIKRDPKNMVRALARIEYHDLNFMLIIRTILNFSLKLITVKEKMNKGVTAATAVAQLQPQVFFKQRDNLALAAKTWDSAQAYELMNKIVELELRCKSISLPPALMLKEELMVLGGADST
ncbi:MAG: DNA polymerase III subunit delta [Proteobacteria bacterium]|nr:DNA polymerase III subunit delta [Pseudomonadota bacterium]